MQLEMTRQESYLWEGNLEYVSKPIVYLSRLFFRSNGNNGGTTHLWNLHTAVHGGGSDSAR